MPDFRKLVIPVIDSDGKYVEITMQPDRDCSENLSFEASIPVSKFKISGAALEDAIRAFCNRRKG